jgi:hypothetical protein
MENFQIRDDENNGFVLLIFLLAIAIDIILMMR